jgi:uncharacterized protein YwqG
MMNKEELKIRLDEAGLAHVSEQLISLAKMSIRFTTAKSTYEEMPIGTSKVGEFPDLPPSLSFPEWNDAPLAFLAQINLGEISSFKDAAALPSQASFHSFTTLAKKVGATTQKIKENGRFIILMT